jgi:glycosyltransferase involved in cell wall biosynthesis
MVSKTKMPDSGSIAVNIVAGPIPESEAALEKTCSQAGNRFILNLLARLSELPGIHVSITSYRPVEMFPRSNLIIQLPRKKYRLGDYEQSQVWFVNVLILKQITMAISIFLQLLMWAFVHRRQRRVMLVYNVFSAFSIPTLLAAWATGSIAVALIADTPHDCYSYKGIKGLLERLDFFQQTRVMRRFSGVICLTKQTWDDFAPGRPGLVVEGGINTDEATEPLREVNIALAEELFHTRVCMYTGALNNLNGIPELLKGFALVADPDVRLWLLGRGECESVVLDAAARDPRISLLGFLPNDEARALQRRVTVLINPRPSQQEITKYTFPSKLLEYLQSGTPVLTTRLPGIPAEYYQHVFPIETETTEGIAEALRRTLSVPTAKLREKGVSAREFVVRDKSWQTQARRIARFLHSLSDGSYLLPAA